jgi:hypothetical protein
MLIHIDLHVNKCKNYEIQILFDSKNCGNSLTNFFLVGLCL